jgi:hypothetical protein
MKTQKKSSYVAAVAALLLVGVVGASACGKSGAELCKSMCDKIAECGPELAKEALGGKDMPEEAMKAAKEEAVKQKDKCTESCTKETDGGRASAGDSKKVEECLGKPCKDFMGCLTSIK